MPPKKVSASSKAATSEKRKVVRTTIAFKKEIIAKYEGGARVSDLAREYSMAKSTISTILRPPAPSADHHKGKKSYS